MPLQFLAPSGSLTLSFNCASSRFDHDGSVNSARRTMRDAYSRLSRSSKNALVQLDLPLLDCKKATEPEQRLMIGEMCVAETRRAFLDAVATSNKTKLKDCQESAYCQTLRDRFAKRKHQAVKLQAAPSWLMIRQKGSEEILINQCVCRAVTLSSRCELVSLYVFLCTAFRS